MSQAEVQEDVLRVASILMDRVAESAEPLMANAPRPTEQETLLRRVLLYSSSAVDIATGPLPELNVLDLLVFTILCRWSLEQHWIPHRLGKDGEPLAAALMLAERDSWEVASKIIDERKQADLRELVATWQSEHSTQYLVEGVRFHEFSEFAGHVENERARKTRGIFSQVKSATRVADQAVLLGERALFVTQRMPYLVRLQIRVGVQETWSDSASRLNEADALLRRAETMQPMLANLRQLTSETASMAREARLLADAVAPIVDKTGLTFDYCPGERTSGLTDTLNAANRLTEQSLSLVREVRANLPNDTPSVIAAVEARADRLIRRWLTYLLVAGAALCVLFWLGYYVVRRVTP